MQKNGQRLTSFGAREFFVVARESFALVIEIVCQRCTLYQSVILPFSKMLRLRQLNLEGISPKKNAAFKNAFNGLEPYTRLIECYSTYLQTSILRC